MTYETHDTFHDWRRPPTWRRAGKVRIGWDFLMERLDSPADTRVLSVSVDHELRTITLLVEGSTMPQAGAGAYLSTIELTVVRSDDEPNRVTGVVWSNE